MYSLLVKWLAVKLFTTLSDLNPLLEAIHPFVALTPTICKWDCLHTLIYSKKEMFAAHPFHSSMILIAC